MAITGLFQSPCGDLLIGNLSEPAFKWSLEVMFQSPCGDLLIGNTLYIGVLETLLKVSVPLRGFINRKHNS